MVLAGALFAGGAGFAQGDDLPPLEEVMSSEEFELTGLGKLSEDELQVLREWLEVFIRRDARSVMRNYREEQRRLDEEAGGKSKKEAGANRFEVVESTLVGTLKGWGSKTTFTLANGQVWENRRKNSGRRTKTVVNPKVIIKKNLLGKYVMEVPAARVKIPVRRIK